VIIEVEEWRLEAEATAYVKDASNLDRKLQLHVNGHTSCYGYPSSQQIQLSGSTESNIVNPPPSYTMDIVQAVSSYVTKMVSAGDSAAAGTSAAKMKVLLLDNETVGLSALSIHIFLGH
jgi:hypothetical protein